MLEYYGGVAPSVFAFCSPGAVPQYCILKMKSVLKSPLKSYFQNEIGLSPPDWYFENEITLETLVHAS